MPRRKQYEYNEQQARRNKEVMENRKGKKWKYMELMRSMNLEHDDPTKLSKLIVKYKKIKNKNIDEEVNRQAERSAKDASERARNGLQARLSTQVQYIDPGDLHLLTMEFSQIPMLSTAYVHLRDDIERKGILIPILITDTRDIIDGHQRVKASIELGINRIPYIEVNLRGLPTKIKTLMTVDLFLGANLHRRHLTIEQKKSIKRKEQMIQQGSPPPGRPSQQELQLRGSRSNMEEQDRIVATICGIGD